MNELCDPEDDEGFTPFMRKYFDVIFFLNGKFMPEKKKSIK